MTGYLLAFVSEKTACRIAIRGRHYKNYQYAYIIIKFTVMVEKKRNCEYVTRDFGRVGVGGGGK